MEPQVISLRDVAVSSVRLAEPATLHLPNRVSHSNLADTNPTFAKHMQGFVYRDRVANLAAIDLVELPAGAVVYGGDHFIAAVEDRFIQEQYPPYAGAIFSDASEIIATERPTEVVEGEMLLIGRFGVGTWGHWIGELLPKVLLAEAMFPGRFRYILPRIVAAGERPPSVWANIADSLRVCGIDVARVYGIDACADYRFEHLFAVSSVWSDYMIHPAASAVLRRGVDHIRADGPERLAVIRDPVFQRVLANADEIHGLLEARGFQLETTGLLPFETQVARFRAARTVFGVLGSDLTNLIFSDQGVSLISVAPDVFGDRFFYGLVLDREGSMADMRGPVVIREEVEHKGTFRVKTEALASVIDWGPARVATQPIKGGTAPTSAGH